MENFFQCLRCNYITDRSQIMRNHLNKNKKCDKINIDSIKYSDEEIYELSTIRVFKRNNFKCEDCNKRYTSKSSLKIHIDKYCKFKNNNKNYKIEIHMLSINTVHTYNMMKTIKINKNETVVI